MNEKYSSVDAEDTDIATDQTADALTRDPWITVKWADTCNAIFGGFPVSGDYLTRYKKEFRP
ncbi:hypothetical protein [Nesterenkonia jeotgali]|uniref:Uncharacterized protein n=1 Tax=Nesterenkonia jeotgali TaxID=317018 RepID=A0A0W8IG71_9MICC|nr:hypothetical protein [Nesterenkonia jeotgali]KUG58958.1 hypothetical protein AVL63_02745 [Nesterenkonia jeotgali]